MTVRPQNSCFYLPQLNGLRLIAFLMIFFVHAPKFTLVGNYPAKCFELNRWLNDQLGITLNFGVDLFFVLSAFLITKLLLMESEKKGTISVKNFLIRRFLRIAPLYYLYIVLCFVPLSMTVDDPMVAKFNTPFYWDVVRCWAGPSVTFLSNNTGTFPANMTPHLWSISLEMQIYVCLPFLLFYLVHSSGPKKNVRGFLAILGGLFFFTTILKYSYILQGQPHPKIYLTTLTRLDPFIAGVLVAIKSQYFPGLFRIPFHLPICLLVLSLNLVFPSPFTPQPVYWLPLIYVVNAVGFGLLLDYLVSRKSLLSRCLSWKPIASMGDLTYGMYVYHLVVLHFGTKWCLQSNLPVGSKYWLPFIALSLASTFGVAFISYHLWEKRFLEFKRKFTTIGRQSGGPPESHITRPSDLIAVRRRTSRDASAVGDGCATVGVDRP